MRVSAAATLLSLTLAAVAVSAQSPAPQSSWQITSLPKTQRESICNNNKAYCPIACQEGKPPKNFCNPDTMGWGCGCTKSTPDLTARSWPILQAECTGRNQACEAECLKTQASNPNPCITQCRSTNDCNAEKLTTSNLVVESVDDVPDYNGTGKGSASGKSGKSGADSLSSSATWSYALGALTAVAATMWTL